LTVDDRRDVFQRPASHCLGAYGYAVPDDQPIASPQGYAYPPTCFHRTKQPIRNPVVELA